LGPASILSNAARRSPLAMLATTICKFAFATRRRTPWAGCIMPLWHLFRNGPHRIASGRGFSYKQVEDEGLFLVVAEMTCRYLRPACTTIC